MTSPHDLATLVRESPKIGLSLLSQALVSGLRYAAARYSLRKIWVVRRRRARKAAIFEPEALVEFRVFRSNSTRGVEASFLEFGIRSKTYLLRQFHRVRGQEATAGIAREGQNADHHLELLQRSQVSRSSRKRELEVAVFVHSKSGWHINLHANLLVELLRDFGVAARVTDENGELVRSEHPLVVAPHEFWGFTGTSHLNRPSFHLRCWTYQTEQVESDWFSKSLHHCVAGKGVIDVSSSTLPIYRGLVPSTSIVLPADKKTLSFIGAESSAGVPGYGERRFDVCLFAGASTYRDYVMERISPYFAGISAHLEYGGPNPPGDWKSEALRFFKLSQSSKIHLSLSRHASGFFTWDRILFGGMAAGALPVVARARPEGPMVGGQDYLSISARQIPVALDFLLRKEEGIRFAGKVRASGSKAVSRPALREEMGAKLVNFLAATGGK